jgi:hypothetical protein
VPSTFQQFASTAAQMPLETRVHDTLPVPPRAGLVRGGRAQRQQLLAQVETAHSAAVHQAFRAMTRHDPSGARHALRHVWTRSNELVRLQAEFGINANVASDDERRMIAMTAALLNVPLGELQAFDDAVNTSNVATEQVELPTAAEYRARTDSGYDLGRRMMIYAVERSLEQSGQSPAHEVRLHINRVAGSPLTATAAAAAKATVEPLPGPHQPAMDQPTMDRHLATATRQAAICIELFSEIDRRNDLCNDEKIQMYLETDGRLESYIRMTPDPVLQSVAGEQLRGARARAHEGHRQLLQFRQMAPPQDQAMDVADAAMAALVDINSQPLPGDEKSAALDALIDRFVNARADLIDRCPLAAIEGQSSLLEAGSRLSQAITPFLTN